jgi:hypothetical protein
MVLHRPFELARLTGLRQLHAVEIRKRAKNDKIFFENHGPGPHVFLIAVVIGGLVTCRDPKDIRYVLWKNGLYGMNPTSIT